MIYQYNVISTIEQLVLTRRMSLFEVENMQTQYVLSYRIHVYFHDNKLPIETDENIDYEMKMQKAIAQKLGCKFNRIDPDKEDFDIFRAIKEVFRHIKQLTKKTRVNKIST